MIEFAFTFTSHIIKKPEGAAVYGDIPNSIPNPADFEIHARLEML